MKRYSVAIRTLAKNTDLLYAELTSIYSQTILPEKVIIYIGDGCTIPKRRISTEIYVPVRKGMMHQRALNLKEITSEYVLMLDDDVMLYPDCALQMLKALEEFNLDCVAADIYKEHTKSIKRKLYDIVVNFNTPHYIDGYGFRIKRDGSFSFNSHPGDNVCLSQSAAGPCSMWQKSKFLSLGYEAELWIDDLGFSYGDDQLAFYKLYINGGRLGIHYGLPVKNLNGKTSSEDYLRNPKRYHIRAMAQYLIWHRSIYSWRNSVIDRIFTATCFWTRCLWNVPIHIFASLRYNHPKIIMQYVKGTVDGIKYTTTNKYKSLPSYIL